MDAAIVVNPVAGRGRALGVAEEAARALRGAGRTVAVHPTDRAGHAAELAGRLALACSVLVAVGGDGTLREVAVGARARRADVVFGLVPMGTGNVVARELGVPLEPAAAIARLAGGARPRRFDVGRARADGGSAHAFLAMVGVGYDARVVEGVARLRARHPEAYARHAVRAYARAGLSQLLVPTGAALEVRVAGTPVGRGLDSVVVANTRVYGRGWSVAPDADPADGLLDVQARPFALGAASFVAMACALLRVAAPRPFARRARGAAVEVAAARPTAWQADGDGLGTFERLAVALEPDPIRILA